MKRCCGVEHLLHPLHSHRSPECTVGARNINKLKFSCEHTSQAYANLKRNKKEKKKKKMLNKGREFFFFCSLGLNWFEQ